jgi:shikimate 5-dehydrogenase
MDQLNLFVFGAGYSARAAIDALRREGGVEVSATTRTLQKAPSPPKRFPPRWPTRPICSYP